jgi:hypothetical protein
MGGGPNLQHEISTRDKHRGALLSFRPFGRWPDAAGNAPGGFSVPLGQRELVPACTIPSTRVTCSTSIGANRGCSLLTEFAAHSDEHSRCQPQEEMTSQRGRSSVRASSGASSSS